MKNLMSSKVEKTVADDNVSGNLSTTDVMLIYVQTLNGKTILINVVNSDTIGRVKQMIEDKEGIPSPMQFFIFKKKPLEDGKTIAEYRIQNQDTIHLTFNLRGGGNQSGPNSGAIGIQVKSGINDKDVIDLELTNSTTIGELKEMVKHKLQIPSNEQISLKFNEVLNNNDKTLAQCNIKDKDKLQLIHDGNSHKQLCNSIFSKKKGESVMNASNKGAKHGRRGVARESNSSTSSSGAMEGETKDDKKKTSVEGEIQAWKMEGKTQTSQVAKPSSSIKQKVASTESETKAIKLRNVSNSNGEEKAESETQASEVGKASCAGCIEKANAGAERHPREVKEASSSTVSSDNNKNINYKLKNKQANVTRESSCRR